MRTIMHRSKNMRQRRQGNGIGRDDSGSRLIRREMVDFGALAVPGELVLVPDMVGLVLIAHASGRSRGQYVASVLQAHRLGTLLFELPRPVEVHDKHPVLGIDSLAARIGIALEQVGASADTGRLPCGLFGVGVGAEAALVAAARSPIRVAAVVSAGGRPDLATASLCRVQAPTLLIVGGADLRLLVFNRAALEQLECDKRLEVVPDAGHLFKQPGALQSVAELAAHWLGHHLRHRQAA